MHPEGNGPVCFAVVGTWFKTAWREHNRKWFSILESAQKPSTDMHEINQNERAGLQGFIRVVPD